MIERLAIATGRALGRVVTGFRQTATLRPRNSGAVYEGATVTRRGLGWAAPVVTPNAAVLGSLATLRARSRAAVRNNGYAKSTLSKLATNLVGTDVAIRSQAPDEGFRAGIQKLWDRWATESDADGVLPWGGQLALVVQDWLESGEMFLRLRSRLPQDGLSVPLQVQLLEPELCPIDYSASLSNGNRVRAGIEFDLIGRRVAYWFYRSRPGDLPEIDMAQLTRLDADSVQHLYLPLRAGQLRGLPHLTTSLLRLRDVDEGDDATLLRWKLANMFMMFLKRGGPAAGEDINPVTGETIQRDAQGRPLMPMEPGLVQELAADEAVEFATPPGPGAQYVEFIRQQLIGASAATDVPYEVVTGDLSHVNDRTVRVILNDFRRRVEQLQYHVVVHQVCRPVWRAFVNKAVISGAVVPPNAFFEDPEAWLAAKFIPQGWPYIHPVQDVEADRNAIRSGLKSRTDAVGERGYDIAEVDAEIAADNARQDELGLVLDSDPRKTQLRGQTAATPTDAGSTPPDATPAAGAQAAAPSPTVNVTVHPPAAPIINVAPPSVNATINATIQRPMDKLLIRDETTKLVKRIEERARDAE